VTRVIAGGLHSCKVSGIAWRFDRAAVAGPHDVGNETEQRTIGEDEKQRFQEGEFGEVAEQRSAA
jgi:hypothetical protein